jgi:cysteine-rich repeat protein
MLRVRDRIRPLRSGTVPGTNPYPMHERHGSDNHPIWSKELRRLNALMSGALFFVIAATALVARIDAALVSSMKDTMSNQAASGTSSHAIAFTLSAGNTFATGEQVAIDFPETSAFTQGGTWATGDFIFNDGTARTVNAVNAGAGVTTVACTNGANNVGVAVDTTALTFRVIPCGASYVASSSGATINFTIDGLAPDGTLTNPASTGSKTIFILNGGGDCTAGGESCQIAIAIVTNPAVNVTATVASTAVCGNGTVEAGESCDDSNTTSGDGCSSTCQSEGGGGGPPPDTTPPVISSVGASGITTNAATITWTTNEASNSLVNYGTTVAYGSSSNDAAYVTSHSRSLSGLSEGTLYHYQVCSTDSASNTACSSDQTFTTLDGTPPVISSVVVSGITATGATITWTTNENATRYVDYGLAAGPPYASTTGAATPLQTSHSVTLTGLTAATTYHYRVRSGDATANESFTANATFSTLDGTPPVISSVVVSGITATGATITWTTNENATRYVDYGLAAGPPYASTTGAATPLQTSHSVTLTGLTEATVYHYRVRSADASANESSTANATFTTADVTAPVISAVASSLVTATGARITWTTNENSDSVVEFGPTLSYGATQTNPTAVTAHQIDLTALTPNTLYHYRVKSKDASNNQATSGDFTFTTALPAAPVISNIQVTNITQTSARVQWDTTTSSNSTVNYGTTVSYGSNGTNASSVTAHLINLTGLTKGTTYHFRVRSTDAYTQEAVSGDGTFATLADTTPPANVTNFTASPGDQQNSLSWTNPVDADFQGVKVMRKTTGYPTGPTDGTVVYSGTGTAEVDTGLTNGVAYYYAAFAFDDVPNYASGAVAGATPVGPADTTPPGNVTSFVATPGDQQVSLSWTNPTDVDFQAVKIVRKTTGFPTGQTDGTLVYEGTATSKLDLGLSNGTLYYYKAFTFDAVPNFSSGTEASATPVAPADTTAPGPVTNFVATAGDAIVQLTWANPTAGDWLGTRVLRKTGSNPTGPSDGIIIFDGVGDNKLDTALANGTAYYYGAYAYDAALNFATPAFVNATPSAGAPPPPALSCTDSDGGKNYEVQGTVTVNGTQNFSDICADVSTVQENFCDAGSQSVESHACGTGYKCSGGRCVADTFVPTAEVCGNGSCAETENSLNCPSDCPVAPTQPPIVPTEPTVPQIERLDVDDLRFFATNAHIQLRVSGGRLRMYTKAAFTVMIPDPSIRKEIKSAFVNFAGSAYAMRQTASFEATVSTPTTAGPNPMSVVVNYSDNSSDVIDLTVDVVPRGRVKEDASGQPSIAGARVTLLVDTGGGNFGLWNGASSGQQNPQTTDEAGLYGFIVPAGTYKLVAEKDGYNTKSTLAFPVTTENVITTELSLIKKPEDVKIEEIFSKPSETVQAVADQATYAAKVTTEQVREVIQNPIVEERAQNVAAPTAVAVAAVNVASAGAATATAIPYLLYIYSFLAHPTLLIARRRRKKWGVVYNALSKLPVDLAIVRLLDAKTGRILRSAVTDKDGRYFFIVQPGEYKMTTVKNGFVFPTVFLKGAKEDVNFVDLYHGEALAVKEETVITANIPLDPIGGEKTPKKILLEGIGRRFQKSLGVISIVAMIVATVITPTPLMFGLLFGNMLMYGVFRRLAIPSKPKNWGIVMDEKTGKPVQNAVARIFEAKYNKLLETQVTDTKGRYAFLVGTNVYYVTFEKPGYQKQQKGPVDLVNLDKKKKDKEGTQVVAVDVKLAPAATGVPTQKAASMPPAPPTPPAVPPKVPPPPAAEPSVAETVTPPPAPVVPSVTAALPAVEPVKPPAPAAAPKIPWEVQMLARLKATPSEQPKAAAPADAVKPAPVEQPKAPAPTVSVSLPAAATEPRKDDAPKPPPRIQDAEHAHPEIKLIQDAEHAHPEEFMKKKDDAGGLADGKGGPDLAGLDDIIGKT